MMALAMAFVGQAVPKEKTGSAMGLLGSMSAIGTALGPSLGGVLIAGPGWRSLFLVNLPLGLLALALAWRFLPADRALPAGQRPRFDHAGTLLLALVLAAYALAMTLGRGSFGALNIALLAAAGLGGALFVLAERRAASPLVRLAMFRDPVLAGGVAMSALATTVVMATLVVGPFYLSGALGLDAARVGLVMSCGPVVAALAGVPAGQLVDKCGAGRITLIGLAAMAAGSAALPLLSAGFGVPGYIGPLAVITAGFALFQAVNNTAALADAPADRRGVIAGLLHLTRNLGLITGASAMGAVYAAAGMHATFAVAAGLVVIALAIAVRTRMAKPLADGLGRA
jgi:predicted MFS family arabinose efflux permease